jgi:hypothetical protein
MKHKLLLTFLASISVYAEAVPVRIDLAAEDSFYSGPSVLADNDCDWKLVTTNSSDIKVSGLPVKMELGGWKIGSVGYHKLSMYNDYRYTSEDTAFIQFSGLDQNSVYDIVIYAGRIYERKYKSVEMTLTRGYAKDKERLKTSPTQFDDFEENGNYVRLKGIQSDKDGVIRFEFDGKKDYQIVNAIEIEEIHEPSAILLTLK